MTPYTLIRLLVLLLLTGLTACTEGDPSAAIESYLTAQKDDDDDDVCDPSEDDYDPNDPRCKPAGPGGTGVTLPTDCAGNDPLCVRASDYPAQADLTIANSENVIFSNNTFSLELVPGSATIVDTDGDRVPDQADDCPGVGWRLPCDGDASDDGIYQTLYFNSNSDVTVRADIDVSGKISKADAYILIDSTGSMRGEQLQLIKDLTTGTFVDTSQCPTGAGTGLVGALQCSIPDIWLGLGEFKELPYRPHAEFFDMTPYHHYLDTTDNVQHMIDAVSSLVNDSNIDLPEAASQALYSVVTGQGLGDLVPNRGACPSTPAGRWGYPCFRPNVLPIILLFTDADMHNGPIATNGHTYTDPPFDGTIGLGSLLPPVEQSPNVLYSSDPFTAWNIGDMTSKSMTVMGSNTNLSNNAQTWDQGACQQCASPGVDCWTDGRDGFIGFSLTAPTDFFLSGQGTSYHTTNVAFFDSVGGIVDCNPGPGGGDYWGRFNATLGAGDWYGVSDASVATDRSVADRVGAYQLRFHNLTADPVGDPSWQTADLPIAWTDVETELLAAGVKFVSVVSPNSGGYIAIPDVEELHNITGSVDQNGDPYIEVIAGDGTGLTTALLDAVRSLVGDTRRDITLVPEDNVATPAVDETEFVTAVTATSCPTAGIQNCLGTDDIDMDGSNDVCLGCLADTQVEFSFRLGNDVVAQTATEQVFDFDMVAMADGTVELNRIPVRVMVPQAGSQFGTGFYQNEYSSEETCTIPPDRPDWGFLSWFGNTPGDTKITFEFFTANFIEDLDNQIPATITIPDDTIESPIDVGQVLLSQDKMNYQLYLRVRAKLEASSDFSQTPELQGWSMRFDCIPFE